MVSKKITPINSAEHSKQKRVKKYSCKSFADSRLESIKEVQNENEASERGQTEGIDGEKLRLLNLHFNDCIAEYPLYNKKIVLSGVFCYQGGKDALEKVLISLGGKISTAVSGQTDFLICAPFLEDGRPYNEGKKHAIALQKGILVLMIDDLVNYLNATVGINVQNLLTHNVEEEVGNKKQSFSKKKKSLDISPPICANTEIIDRGIPFNNKEGILQVVNMNAEESGLVGETDSFQALFKWAENWIKVKNFSQELRKPVLVYGSSGTGKSATIAIVMKNLGARILNVRNERALVDIGRIYKDTHPLECFLTNSPLFVIFEDMLFLKEYNDVCLAALQATCKYSRSIIVFSGEHFPESMAATRTTHLHIKFSAPAESVATLFLRRLSKIETEAEPEPEMCRRLRLLSTACKHRIGVVLRQIKFWGFNMLPDNWTFREGADDEGDAVLLLNAAQLSVTQAIGLLPHSYQPRKPVIDDYIFENYASSVIVRNDILTKMDKALDGICFAANTRRIAKESDQLRDIVFYFGSLIPSFAMRRWMRRAYITERERYYRSSRDQREALLSVSRRITLLATFHTPAIVVSASIVLAHLHWLIRDKQYGQAYALCQRCDLSPAILKDIFQRLRLSSYQCIDWSSIPQTNKVAFSLYFTRKTSIASPSKQPKSAFGELSYSEC